MVNHKDILGITVYLNLHSSCFFLTPLSTHFIRYSDNKPICCHWHRRATNKSLPLFAILLCQSQCLLSFPYNAKSFYFGYVMFISAVNLAIFFSYNLSFLKNYSEGLVKKNNQDTLIKSKQ